MQTSENQTWTASLKAAREKDTLQTEEQRLETPETSYQKQSEPKTWSEKAWKENQNKTPVNLESFTQLKMSLKNEGKVKTFSSQWKLIEFIFSKPGLQDMLKNVIQ